MKKLSDIFNVSYTIQSLLYRTFGVFLEKIENNWNLKNVWCPKKFAIDKKLVYLISKMFFFTITIFKFILWHFFDYTLNIFYGSF